MGVWGIFYVLFFVVAIVVYLGWVDYQNKKGVNRKYWFIARREVHNPENVTIAGPFDSMERSTLYLIKHRNIGIIMNAYQYELPAKDVKTAQSMIINGVPYIREFQPELSDRIPSLN